MANIIGGFIALALGVITLLFWWWRVVDLIQGLIPLALIAGGLVAAFAGVSMLDEKAGKTVPVEREKPVRRALEKEKVEMK